MKICRQCAMEMPDQALKCPYCRSWKDWRTLLRHEQMVHQWLVFCVLFVFFLVGGILMVRYIVKHLSMYDYSPAILRQVQVSDTHLAFGEIGKDASVAVLGTMTNHGAQAVRDPRLHVEYLDANGAVLDVGEREIRLTLFPNVPTSFKLSLQREFPAASYATATITITGVAKAR